MINIKLSLQEQILLRNFIAKVIYSYHINNKNNFPLNDLIFQLITSIKGNSEVVHTGVRELTAAYIALKSVGCELLNSIKEKIMKSLR